MCNTCGYFSITCLYWPCCCRQPTLTTFLIMDTVVSVSIIGWLKPVDPVNKYQKL